MIETLDNKFKFNCEPNYSEYERIIRNTSWKIPDFFKNFKKSQEFLMSMDKWNSDISSGAFKPGIETYLPNWTVSYLLNKFCIENNITDDLYSHKSQCIYFYKEILEEKNYIHSKGIIPHTDGFLSEDGCLQHVCLINCSNSPITTTFWKFKDKFESKTSDEYEEYIEYMMSKNKEYYENSYESNNFLEQCKEIVFSEEITYKPNECIIYPSNLYHAPKIEEKFDMSDPRLTLTIRFDILIK
tara:strand:+ start:920 stop:1645 length:726 start_codon:yes stop_codon:yes gene_type:complete